jgi:hypothetical protein
LRTGQYGPVEQAGGTAMGQASRIGMRVLAVALAATGLMLTAKVLAPPAVVQVADGRPGSIVPVEDRARSGTVPVVAPVRSPPNIAVTVPTVAVIKVDSRGRVTAVMTNSSRAPRAGDELWIVQPDGSMRVPTSTETADFVARRWVGDFGDPGTFVDQPVA